MTFQRLVFWLFERYFLLHVATAHKVENISVYTILLFASYGNNSQSWRHFSVLLQMARTVTMVEFQHYFLLQQKQRCFLYSSFRWWQSSRCCSYFFAGDEVRKCFTIIFLLQMISKPKMLHCYFLAGDKDISSLFSCWWSSKMFHHYFLGDEVQRCFTLIFLLQMVTKPKMFHPYFLAGDKFKDVSPLFSCWWQVQRCFTLIFLLVTSSKMFHPYFLAADGDKFKDVSPLFSCWWQVQRCFTLIFLLQMVTSSKMFHPYFLAGDEVQRCFTLIFLLQMVAKVKKIARKAQKERNHQAKKGEGDRVILDMKPKHLFSGKRGSGKTDRR